MSADNWRELLDDPDIRRTVQMVVSMTPLTHDPVLDGDLEGWLWERAIRIATRYELHTDAYDPTRMWRAYLWTALRQQALHHRAAIYGNPGYARHNAETARVSLDGLIEATGEATTVLAASPRHRGWHSLTPDDPLAVVLHVERLEAVLRYVTTRPAATYTTKSDLCSEPMCLRKATRRGLCEMHYRRAMRRWGMAHRQWPVGCKVPGCDAPHTARGWCRKHYDQARQKGEL